MKQHTHTHKMKTRMDTRLGYARTQAGKKRHLQNVLRKSCSLTSLHWWDEPLSAIKKKKKILLEITHRLLKACVSHRDNSTVSLFTAKYSAATSRATQDWAQNGEERWAACICKGGKKKKIGLMIPGVYFFVVICVFQVKLQIRGHFHHRGLQQEA